MQDCESAQKVCKELLVVKENSFCPPFAVINPSDKRTVRKANGEKET